MLTIVVKNPRIKVMQHKSEKKTNTSLDYIFNHLPQKEFQDLKVKITWRVVMEYPLI